MCLIIHKQKDATIPSWLLESASEINPHGFGIAWRGPTSNKFYFFKTACSSWRDQLETATLLLKHVGSEETIIHFRLRTQGKVDKENCHPIRVNSSKGYWLLFHNGHFHNFGDDVKSDTVDFAETILKPLLKDHSTLTPKLRTAIENLVSGQKVVLVSPNGEIFKFPKNWHKLGNSNVYLSNLYAWRHPKERRYNIVCEIDKQLVQKYRAIF